MSNNQMSATAFAEGFVKECAARGLDREQAQEAWDKMAQNFPQGMGQPGAPTPGPSEYTKSFWDHVRGAGKAYRGTKEQVGKAWDWTASRPAWYQQAAGEALQGLGAYASEPFGKFKHEFTGQEGTYGGAEAQDAASETELAATKSRIDAARNAAGRGQVDNNAYSPMFGAQFGRFGYDPYSRPGGKAGQIMHNPYRSGFSGIYN